MELTVRRTLEPAQQERIQGVCTPCDQFLPESFECRLVRRGGQWFLLVFENKRCNPRRFLEGFLRRRASSRLGHDLEDVVQDTLLDLASRPPTSFPSNDLIGMQRLLAARALHVAVDHQRKLDGRIRCGNCGHHRVGPEHQRLCAHPDPQHPWTGREVQASLDPRTFEPPCERYVTRRERVTAAADEQDPLDRLPDPAGGADAALAEKERARLILECMAAVQRDHPRAHFAVLMAYFKNETNDKIARSLNATVRTVTRYKERGLAMLREELESRGIRGAFEFE